MNKNCIAIIPARGGSKRIPRKNINLFHGEPIISYSIRAALASGCFSEVMVSTDDDEIADISKKYGASIPFMRSKNSANDIASLEDVALEVLTEHGKKGRLFESFCCLLATAPFIRAEDIKKAIDILHNERDVTSVFTIAKFSYPIQRALKINDGWVEMHLPENMDKRSQELKEMHHDAGQFYCLHAERFQLEKQFFSQRSKAIILPAERVQDIDTLEDWKIAELKYAILNNLLIK
ncbi:MAG: pseudaminic acid cytidylyltransferase [Patescibacteria group bacterium]|jgi:N-acylneuraminate cytidylyltransferase